MDTTTRQRSDSDLDREWIPSGRRPQSTMARHFSVTLDDLFKIDNSIADLDAAVDQKKRIVDNHNSELRALEERLKAAEERLKATAAAVQSGGSPKASANPTTNTGLFAETTLVERPKSKQSMASRPGTAGRAVEQHTVNGEFRRPPTPGASGSEDEK